METTKKAIDDLRERVDRLTKVVESGRVEVEEFTREKPIVALGIAFLVGVASGAVICAAVSSKK